MDNPSTWFLNYTDGHGSAIRSLIDEIDLSIASYAAFVQSK